MTTFPQMIAAIHCTSINKAMIVTQIADYSKHAPVPMFEVFYIGADGQRAAHLPTRTFWTREALNTFTRKELDLDAGAAAVADLMNDRI
jgi:hypothetical protein